MFILKNEIKKKKFVLNSFYSVANSIEPAQNLPVWLHTGERRWREHAAVLQVELEVHRSEKSKIKNLSVNILSLLKLTELDSSSIF